MNNTPANVQPPRPITTNAAPKAYWDPMNKLDSLKIRLL